MGNASVKKEENIYANQTIKTTFDEKTGRVSFPHSRKDHVTILNHPPRGNMQRQDSDKIKQIIS